MQEMEKENEPDRILERLQAIPTNLADQYQSLLVNVDAEHQKQVSLLLKWAVFAFRPLTERELSNVIDIQASGFPRPSVMEIVGMTNGMLVTQDVTPDDGGSVIRLAHASVRDFLLVTEAGDSGIPHAAEAHKEMLDVCLEILVEGGGSQPVDLRQYPLLQYAAEFWPKHLEEARKGDPHELSLNEKTSRYLRRLFDAAAPAAFLSWLRLSDPAEPESGVQLTKNLEDFRPMDFYLDLFELQSSMVRSQRNSMEEEHQGDTSGSRSRAKYRILCCRPH